jgi:hypothetical protein
MSGSTRHGRAVAGWLIPRVGARPRNCLDKCLKASPQRAAARPDTNGCSTWTPLRLLKATGFHKPKTTANSLTSKE